MLLISWNVAGRVKRRPEQVAALAGAGADVLALQEVTATTLAGWRADLAAAGFSQVRTSFDAGVPARRGARRPLGVLVAVRAGTLEVLDGPVIPWPERLLRVRLARDGLELVNLHSPISPAPDLAKVRTHEAVHRFLASRTGAGPALLCGDLNTPRRERPDGEVWTFARESNGRLRPARGERWDRAELALIKGLEPHGWRDAFRHLHGYGRKEVSWAWPSGGGYRLDHLIVTDDVEIAACEYVHDWRLDGLSDHSALCARLVLPAG